MKTILCLITTFFMLNYFAQEPNCTIIKQVDNQDSSFVFMLYTPKNTSVSDMMTNANMAYLNDMPLGVFSDPGCFHKLSSGMYFWNETINKKDCGLSQGKELMTLQWSCYLSELDILCKYNVFVGRDSFSHVKDCYKNKMAFLLLKNLDGKGLSFSLFVNNGTGESKCYPNFFSPHSNIKLKFPSGRIYTPPFKQNAENIELKPGESKSFQIDLEQLLKESKDFSMKDFEYGLTELVWEIKLDDGKVITRNFWLVKFNGELPNDNGNGYKLDGPLTLETFRDKKISVLPPAKPYIPEQKNEQ